MSENIKILAFAGSLRKESYNKKLVAIAAKAAIDAGAEVQVVDLKDYPLPVFNEDLEAEETPENALKLKKLFVQSDGLLIASPEYNSCVTAALKNTIDWVSRRSEGEPPLAAFAGKVAGIMSASPGGLGGMRGLVSLRSILSNIQTIVLPDQVALPSAHNMFDESGGITDKGKQEQIEALARKVAEVATKLQ